MQYSNLDFLCQQGELARVQGDYAQASQSFQQAVQLAKTHDLMHQPYGMQLINNLAVVYKYCGRFDEAEAIYQSLLADLTRQQSEHSCAVAAVYHNLAGLKHAQADYAAAEPFARKSHELYLKLLGKEHLLTIADKAALGSILHGLARWDEAILCFESAIASFERRFGPVHYEIAINLNNLAASYQAKGNVKLAENIYVQALKVKKILLGPNHPDVAISLNNLASLLQQTGKEIEAKALFVQAITIFEATVGLHHPYTQQCQNNIANLAN